MSERNAEAQWLIDVGRRTRDLEWANTRRGERDRLADDLWRAGNATREAARAWLALHPWERDPSGAAQQAAQIAEDAARDALTDYDRLARLVDGIAYVVLASGAGPRPIAGP